MALLFNPGVSLRNVRPEAVAAMVAAKDAYANAGVGNMMVTSCTDGVHMVGSLHYKGLAFDLRTHGTGSPQRVLQIVNETLSPIGYIVLLEDLGTPNEHIHVQVGKGSDWLDLPEISGPNVVKK